MNIRLRQIDRHHKEEFMDANVSEELERFMSRNLDTILGNDQSSDYAPYAIMTDEGRMVGFVMVGQKLEEGSYWLAKLMIDTCERRKGYGTGAMRQAIQMLKESPGCKSIQVTYHRDNVAAKAMLDRMGFTSVGDGKEGPIVATLAVSKQEACQQPAQP
ncbi:MAG: GNAT family N-acetyltransferase [Candidatus Cryosericum sp.]